MLKKKLFEYCFEYCFYFISLFKNVYSSLFCISVRFLSFNIDRDDHYTELKS